MFIPIQHLSQCKINYPSTKIFLQYKNTYPGTKIFFEYKWGKGTYFPEAIATFLEAHANMAAAFPGCFRHCYNFKIVDPVYRYCPKSGTEVFRVASSTEST